MIENAEEFTNYYLYGENREKISNIKINIYDWQTNEDIVISKELVLIKTLGEEDENGYSDLIGNSFSFTEGIIEDSTFKLGAFVIPQIEIQRIYNGVSYKNKHCKVFQDFVDTDNNIFKRLEFMNGIVSSEKFNEDHSIVTMSISILEDAFYNENIAETLREMFVGGVEITLSYFISTVFNLMSGLYFDEDKHKNYFTAIETDAQGTQTLYYIPIGNFLKEDTEVSLLDIYRMIGEAFGVFFRFNKYLFVTNDIIEWLDLKDVWRQTEIEFCNINNTFDFLTPTNNKFPKETEIYPLQYEKVNFPFESNTYSYNDVFEYPYNIRSEYDEETITKYNSITFSYAEINYGTQRFVTFGVDENGNFVGRTPIYPNLKIEDNLIFVGVENTQRAGFVDVVILMGRAAGTFCYSKFINARLEVPYLPTLESGDNVLFRTNNGYKVMPYLLCESRGMGQIRANISSNSNVEE